MDEVELERTKHNAFRAKLGKTLITKEEWSLALQASENDFDLAGDNADRTKEGLPPLTKDENQHVKDEAAALVIQRYNDDRIAARFRTIKNFAIGIIAI